MYNYFKNIVEESISQKFKLKNIDEKKISFLKKLIDE